MRTLLVLAALVVAAVLYVLSTSEVHSKPTDVESLPQEAATATTSSQELAAPAETAERVEAEVVSSEPEAVTFAACPPGFSRIDVRVRDGRRPVAGARVRVSEEVDPVFLGEPDEEGACRTDASGRASFHVRALRTVQVTASTDGSVWARSELVTSSFEKRSRTIVVELETEEDDATFVLFVRSYPTLDPVAGAEVEVESTGRADLDPSKTLVTGPDGRVELPWREEARYAVRADGHAETSIDAPDAPGGEPSGVTLNANARLYGTLAPLDDDSADGPLRVVRLLERPRWSNEERRIIAESTGRAYRPAVQERHRTTVAPDGSWSMDGIEFAPYPVKMRGIHVTDEGMFPVGAPEGDLGPPRLEGLRVTVEIGSTERTLVHDLDLSPGDVVEVRDEWAGAPDVTIDVRYASGEPVGSRWPFYVVDTLRTPARIVAEAQIVDGRVVIQNLPTRTWSYATRYVDPRKVRVDGTFEHDASGTARVTVVGFDAIAGRAEGASARSGLIVQVTRIADGRILSSCRTDARGAFRCEYVPTGEDVDVAVGEFVRVPGSQEGEWASRFHPAASIITRAGVMDITLDAEGSRASR